MRNQPVAMKTSEMDVTPTGDAGSRPGDPKMEKNETAPHIGAWLMKDGIKRVINGFA